MLANAVPWQEIIAPAAPPAPLWPVFAWGLAGLLWLALMFWLFWLWWRQPRRAARRRLERIRREIANGVIEPRTGLYAAAACMAGLGAVGEEGQLLAQRFAHQPPERVVVESLLRRLQGRLAR